MLSTGRLLKLTRNLLMTSLNESKVKSTFNMDRCSSFSENFKPSLLSLSSQGRGLQKIGIYSPKSKFPILLQSHWEFLINDAEAEMIIPKYFKYVHCTRQFWAENASFTYLSWIMQKNVKQQNEFQGKSFCKALPSGLKTSQTWTLAWIWNENCLEKIFLKKL